MGRKYTTIQLSSEDVTVKGIIAFIDTGADLTIISRKIARRLKIQDKNIEIKWTASDGDERFSPIVPVSIKDRGDSEFITLHPVLVDDVPLDRESKEEAILGLDYLQKARKVISFEDD